MTLEKLRHLVIILSNQLWVRYWIHWNYPARPTKMAISCIDMAGVGHNVYESDLPPNWTKELHEDKVYYIWDRLDEDGEPWEMRL